MNTERVTDRIQELMVEQAALEHNHSEMIRGNQKMNEQFQQTVVKNQTRYAQITGAITELQKLVKPSTQKDNNHDNLSTTPNFHHRTPDVCLSGEPEDR